MFCRLQAASENSPGVYETGCSQRGARFSNEANLEQSWPQFAGDKKALSVCIVGDSVQHRARFETIDWTQQALKIDPSDYLSTLRRDACDSIGLPDVGENFSLYELKFVQLRDGSIPIMDCDATFFSKRIAIQNADYGRSVAQEELITLVVPG